MSLVFKETKHRYRTIDGKQFPIIRKKGYRGFTETLEKLTPKKLSPKGWAIVRMASNHSGIFHYYEKNIQHSFCGTLISDIPKKRLYIDPKAFKTQKYRPCFYCVKQLKEFKITGIIPRNKSKENPNTALPKITRQIPTYKKKQLKLKPEMYIQVSANCSYPNCPETGVTYIKEDENITTHHHFCIKHNPRIKRNFS